MRGKNILIVSIFAVLFSSCAIKDENPTPQKPIEAGSKLSSMAITDSQIITDPDEGEFIFLEKNKDLFVESRIDSFLVPDYYLFKKYNLTLITDSLLTNRIYEQSNIDSYNAKTHYYSIENRLSNFQDFTVFIVNDYSYNIVYCIMNNENQLTGTLVVAYQFSEGEYSEYASGKFINNYEYHLYIEGVADPFEDGEEYYEGSSTETTKKYIIDEAGMIEDI